MSPGKTSKGDSVRQRAEGLLSKRPEAISKILPKDVKKLIHELHVHQIELEMQNEELRKAQAEIESSRSRYFDLYDFAPVGYVTLDRKGMILEANLAGAKLLDVERSKLLSRPFIRFVSPESRNTFHLHLERVFSTSKREVCDLELIKKSGKSFYVSLKSVSSKDNEGHSIQCLSAIIDITERREAQEALKKAHDEIRFFASQCLTVQETERKRVASELHDSIAASLTAMRLRIDTIADDIRQGYGNVESLQDLTSMLTDTNSEVRRIMADLRPAVLDDLGIIAAINWFCREYQKTYAHISVENQIEISEDEVPASLKTPLFRISQEAMNNIAKHSHATLVNLSLRRENNKILLTIRDNGQGFDLETAKRGLGLSTMVERAQLSRGTCTIESIKGAGTTVRCSWPWT